MHIHSLWWCSDTFHTSIKDVKSSQWWFTASTISSCHHFIATLTPNYQNLGQLCQCNRVRREHPYTYQQQMMVLKHFSYIKHGGGEQSVVVYSLNNVIMPSFHSSHIDPKLPKSGPTLPVELCKGAPICLSTAYEECSNTFCMSNMDLGSSQW